jgi:hypothetical protein
MLKGSPPLSATSWAGKTGLSEPMPMPGPAWEDYGPWARRLHLDLPALQRYQTAVRANTDAYIASLSPADLEAIRDLSNVGLGMVNVGWILARLVVGHMDNECGEISCLKGLQGLRGYPG